MSFVYLFKFKFFEGDAIEPDPASEEVYGLDTLIALVEGLNCTPVLLAPIITRVTAPIVAQEVRKLLHLDQAIAVLGVSAPY